MNNLTQDLKELYLRIHQCKECFALGGCIGPDAHRVERQIPSRIVESELMIVGQSLAADQVRLSGIPFHDVSGEIGRSGRFLETYLNEIGYSLKPESVHFKYAYSTDIIKCYPGKKSNGTGDNKPSLGEIERCKQWLIRELELIDIKIMILMGGPAISTVFAHFLNRKISSITALFGQQFEIKLNGKALSLFCLPHPTSMVVGKSQIFMETFKAIGSALRNRKPDALPR